MFKKINEDAFLKQVFRSMYNSYIKLKKIIDINNLISDINFSLLTNLNIINKVNDNSIFSFVENNKEYVKFYRNYIELLKPFEEQDLTEEEKDIINKHI